MTDIQVKYWGNVENNRHNLATEGENLRHNTQTETQAQQDLIETNRSNVAREGENVRHNKAYEFETYRNNVANLTEASRHNRSTESIGRTQASASMIQAGAAVRNADSTAIKAASEVELTNAKKDYQMMENMNKAANLDIEQKAKGFEYAITPSRTISGMIGDIFGNIANGAKAYKAFK